MAKQAFSSPQEVEAAEQEAEEQRETAEEEAGEQPEEPKGEEQPETSESEGEEQPTGEESESEEQEQGEDFSSDLDDTLTKHGAEPVEEITEEEPEGEEEEPESYEPLDLDIITDDFEEITTNPEAFQEFISKVRQDAVAEARAEFNKQLGEEISKAKEEILQNIPEVVNKTAQRTQNVKQLRDQFFEKNPALKNKMGYVRDMTNTVSSQNPDWSASDVLNEVANRAKRDLDLSQQAQEREKQRKKDPKFAGAGGRRSPGGESDQRGKQDKLLDDTFGN